MTTSKLDPCVLYDQPAYLGALGARARQRAFGDRVWVCPAPRHPIPDHAALVRDQEVLMLAAWPEPVALRPHDRVVVQVPTTPEGRARYAAWLHALAAAAPAELSVAPVCATAGGMHRLWCIAAARVLLPPAVHVEVRHDLVGIRLAQLAVGFGADTLAGPIEPDRTLPLAGVTRPDENTAAGLATLVRQVGLCPQTSSPGSAPRS